mmetsp:Transcript_26499/g.40209  ORF Transcript_26499/g.40209 Transcript_26499/m.40209 type:complete len:408 (-) Transcript_26499:147-1370(-)
MMKKRISSSSGGDTTAIESSTGAVPLNTISPDDDDDGEAALPLIASDFDAQLRLHHHHHHNDAAAVNNMDQRSILEMRERLGFCTTCPGAPTKLYEITTQTRYNNFRSKMPFNQKHESYQGICLTCHPQVNPDISQHRAATMHSSPHKRSTKRLGGAASRRRDQHQQRVSVILEQQQLMEQQQQQQQQQGDKTTAAGSGSGCCVTAPWSLRRELAMEEGVNKNITILKSYDITAAMTFEPPGPYQEAGADSTTFPSPPSRLRATYKVQGYFLPDPQVPNRLTVWFTGGQLAPAFHNCASPEQQQQQQDDEGKQKQQEQQYGDLNAWMELFGAEHRRSWGEALGLMGAKLFLGADLPDGMEPDGTMSYSLHRPYGGHGKGYVDVLYADQDLLITRGNSGTLHVMISNN